MTGRKTTNAAPSTGAAASIATAIDDRTIRVAVPDMAALERFILEQLSPMKEVEKIRSSFALKQVRYKTALPLHNL